MNEGEPNLTPGKPGDSAYGHWPAVPGPEISAERTVLLVGAPNTGKTLFALQMLVNAARRGEPGIFVSFEDEPARLRAAGAGLGLDVRCMERSGALVLHGRIQARVSDGGRFELPYFLDELSAIAGRIGARRVVLDGMHVLLAMLTGEHSEAEEICMLRDWLLEHGFAAALTAAIQPAQLASNHPCLEVAADCVVAFEHRLEAGASGRYLRLLKYRGVSLPDNRVMFAITPEGMFATPLQTRVSESCFPVAECDDIGERLRQLDGFLEVKQAELDFAIEKSLIPAVQEPAASTCKPQRAQFEP